MRNRHITVDFFVTALPARVQALLEAAAALLGIFFWWLVAWRAAVHSLAHPRSRRGLRQLGRSDLAVLSGGDGRQRPAGFGARSAASVRAMRIGNRMMDTTTVGVIGFAAMLGLMFLGVPIGVAMGAVGFFGFAWVNGWNSALNMLSLAPYSAVATTC